MKLIFKRISESCVAYNRNTEGYVFIESVNDDINLFQSLVDNYSIVELENGKVVDMNNKWEVANSVNDKCFDFGDYSYTIEDVNSIHPDEFRLDEMKVKAIQLANPWNKQFILDKITM